MIARMREEAGALGEEQGPILLQEMASFLAPGRSGTDLQARGLVVRDLTPLLDGHYYLPAFSLQFVGRALANHLGIGFEDLWRSAYAEALGRAKAQLLLHFTLQLETPNTQNVLIQLDRNLRPTGRIVLRDLADSFVVEPLAQARGEGELLAREQRVGNPLDRDLRLETENSFWRLDEDPEHHIPRETLEGWKEAHDKAFVGEVLRLLRLEPSLIEASGVSVSSPAVCSSEVPSVSDLSRLLFSEPGLEAYRQFIARGRSASGRTR